MKEAYEKLTEIVTQLPDFCQRYVMEGLSSLSDNTQLSYARDLKYFFDLSGSMYDDFPVDAREITLEHIKNLTAADINRYFAVMKQKQKLSIKTQARRKSALSGLFLYLVNSERVLEYNPVAGSTVIRIPSKDNVIYLSREEQDQLLQTVEYGTGLDDKTLQRHDFYKSRDLAIIVLFLDTGLRISELCNINIKHIDFRNHFIRIIRKGGKEQQVYFSDETEHYISDYLRERMSRQGYNAEDPLFLSNRNERISVRTVQYMVEKYVKAALPGKEGISPHKLRSSFAMEFYKYNKDILMLQQRMGHKSIVATNIYAKAADNELIKETRNWREAEKE